MSQDTYTYNINNPVELNRYVYTGNNPVNLTDPSGNTALFEFAVSTLKATASGAAVGFVGGAVYGIVASLAQVALTLDLLPDQLLAGFKPLELGFPVRMSVGGDLSRLDQVGAQK